MVQSSINTLHQSTDGKQHLTGTVEKQAAKMLAGQRIKLSETLTSPARLQNRT
ncbi:hypothetical protein [Nostoc sp.]|uniref:hypothetical protein n=1 Tax=Nostoc sp. TaxID=1180 RepID=UPI002FF59C6E